MAELDGKSWVTKQNTYSEVAEEKSGFLSHPQSFFVTLTHIFVTCVI